MTLTARRPFPHPSWAWPQGGRALLLQAALLPDPDAALAALQAWLAAHDLDEIGYADHRLLAAIAERHGTAIADLPAWPRLRGLQRQLWTRSRMRVHANLPMLQALSEAGVELMLLKGAARIALNPAAQRQRAHQDVDILVREEQIKRAAQVLASQGWQTARGDTALSAVARAPATRAINFQQPLWGDIDLHRCAWHGGNYDHALDAALWDRAENARYFDLPVRVPEAAERLAMTLSHGAWSPQTHSDWLLDAADLLASQVVDWPYFAKVVAQRRIGSQVAIGLSYLQDGLGLPLPAGAQPHLVEKCAWPTLVIARAEEDLPGWLRPLRRLCFALGRSRRDRSRQALVPPLSIARARKLAVAGAGGMGFTASMRPEGATALPAGKYLFRADLVFRAPERRRRIELELNSPGENLARFRVFATPSASGQIRVRLRLKLKLTTEVSALELEARPGTLLLPEAPASRRAKYAALPFRVESQELRAL